MGKLFFYATGVLIVLVGLTVALYLLPIVPASAGCNDHCKEMANDKKCHECRTERSWKDADGKMHKEIRIEMRDEKGCSMHGNGMMEGGCKDGNMKMENGCGGHGQMNMEGGSCQMHGNMQMGGCCCCCRGMMNGGMMKDSMKVDTTVRIKVRSKI